MNCPHGHVPEQCAKCREIMSGMLRGLALVGPIESAVWVADFFSDMARRLKAEGHDHGGHQDTVILFCDELRIVAERFRPLVHPGKPRRQ